MTEFWVGWGIITSITLFSIAFLLDKHPVCRMIGIVGLTGTIILTSMFSLGWPHYTSIDYLRGGTIYYHLEGRFLVVQPEGETRLRLVEIPFTPGFVEALQEMEGQPGKLKKEEEREGSDNAEEFDGYEFEMMTGEGEK